MDVRDLISELIHHDMEAEVYLDVNGDYQGFEVSNPKWAQSEQIFLRIDDDSLTLIDKDEPERLQEIEEEYKELIDERD